MPDIPRHRRIPAAVILAALIAQPAAAVESDDETAQGAVQVATETLEAVETPSARSVPEVAPTTPDPPTIDQALDAMTRSARSGPVAAFEILEGSIPPGETLSYGALAARLGNPKASRAVGLANGSNPVAIVVPCHRVIGAGGSLTGFGGGIERKRWLLQHEAAHAPRAMDLFSV